MDSGIIAAPSWQRRHHFAFAANFPARYARFGAFDLDLQKQELFKNGLRVKLQGKISQALLILLEKHGEVVTREALRLRLWPLDEHVNYNANVNTTVNKLRLVLGDSSERPFYVETIPRKGYSFFAPVEFLENLPARRLEPREQTQNAGFAATPQLGAYAGELRAEASERRVSSGERRASFLRMMRPSTWAAAGAIALVVAGFLLGAAIMLYAHRLV